MVTHLLPHLIILYMLKKSNNYSITSFISMEIYSWHSHLNISSFCAMNLIALSHLSSKISISYDWKRELLNSRKNCLRESSQSPIFTSLSQSSFGKHEVKTEKNLWLNHWMLLLFITNFSLCQLFHAHFPDISHRFLSLFAQVWI